MPLTNRLMLPWGWRNRWWSSEAGRRSRNSSVLIALPNKHLELAKARYLRRPPRLIFRWVDRAAGRRAAPLQLKCGPLDDAEADGNKPIGHGGAIEPSQYS